MILIYIALLGFRGRVAVYFLMGKEAVWRVISRLAEMPHERSNWDSQASLRKDLVDFYRMVQLDNPLPEADLPLFCTDEARTKALLNLYSKENGGNFEALKARPMEPRIQNQIESKIIRSLSGWKVLEPDLAKIFDVVVHTLFFQASEGYGGGSLASALGVIWVGENEHWEGKDWQEFLLHELTHQLLFLDAYLEMHFDNWDALVLSDSQVYSAILKRPRPFHLAYHGLFVVYEVLSFRRLLGEPAEPKVHAPSAELLPEALKSAAHLAEVDGQRNLMTKRSRFLLARVTEGLQALQ